MPLRKDIWRCGIACDPLATIVQRGSLAESRIVWLPEEGSLRFLADPFGVWRDGLLYIFVEVYDYRHRIGRIDVLTYGADLVLRDRKVALAEPWHLSYPLVFDADGETWMLPEAHRGGGLTLYRAISFPGRWVPETRIELREVPIDATPVFHHGLWWLFYSPGTDEFSKQGVLHAAFAQNIRGPWTPHPANPLRRGKDGSRPAGRAVVSGDDILLPVQDCRHTYGAATRLLRIKISPIGAETALDAAITPPSDTAGHDEGMHTLSDAGPVTLFDVKRIDLSARGVLMEGGRELRKLRARLRS